MQKKLLRLAALVSFMRAEALGKLLLKQLEKLLSYKLIKGFENSWGWIDWKAQDSNI